MKNRIIEFDIMRALAIFFILFHHLPGHSFNFYSFHFNGHLWDLTFLYSLNAYFGLGLFVFVSGRLLSKPNPSFEEGRNIKQFILKRYIRIFPLYIIALLLFVAINGRVWDSMGIRDSLSIYSFVLNLLGLQIILASKYCRPLLTLWFVGLIVSYYYLYIVFVKFVRSFIGFITLVFTISLFSALFMHLLGLMDERFLFYLGVFIAGILEAKYKLIEKMKFGHVILVLLLFISFVCLYVAFIYPEKIPPGRPSFLSFIGMNAFVLENLIMLSFVSIVFALARVIVRTDRYAFLQKIAYASYCIFLFHRPVWWIMVDIYNPADVKFKAVYLALLGIPLTIFVSYYLQKFYDRYFERRFMTNDSLRPRPFIKTSTS
jgi:peptidoglycan/LPS O-acetylase OafA/YrhL